MAQYLANPLRYLKPQADVECRLRDIKMVISLGEIKPKVEALVQELRELEIDVFLSLTLNPKADGAEVLRSLMHENAFG